MKKIGKFNSLLILFFIVNILQSIFTPISEDEAYYWMFSKSLDWGYFDHPPMVAFLIKIGSLFFSDTLGIRFVSVILFTFLALILWRLIPEERKHHNYSEIVFFGVLLSIPLFHIYGFITTPDTPLLFFSALYLLVFKKLIEEGTIVNAFWVGIVAALLIYSKYHGGIFILISVLVVPKILLKKEIYIAGFVALLLITPHIYWQYNNDFITFNYHLFQRPKFGFSFKDLLGSLERSLGMFAAINPFLVIITLIYFKQIKSALIDKDRFILRLLVTLAIFFFVYSLRNRIEAHWGAVMLIPLTIVLYQFFITKIEHLTKLKYIAIISISIFLILRIALVIDLPIKSEFHSERKEYFAEIAAFADKANVGFVDSYQRTSKYIYYTGRKSFPYNTYKYRKNQYDLWQFDNGYFNAKKVLLIGEPTPKMADSLVLKTNESIVYKGIDKYPEISKIKISARDEFPLKFEVNKQESFTVNIDNPYNYNVDLAEYDLDLSIIFENKHTHFIIPLESESETFPKNKKVAFKMSFTVNNKPELGTYTITFLIGNKNLLPQRMSKKYNVIIE